MTDRRDKSGPWNKTMRYHPKDDLYVIASNSISVDDIIGLRNNAVHEAYAAIVSMMTNETNDH